MFQHYDCGNHPEKSTVWDFPILSTISAKLTLLASQSGNDLIYGRQELLP